jgi:hypothetical protein
MMGPTEGMDGVDRMKKQGGGDALRSGQGQEDTRRGARGSVVPPVSS